MKSYQQIKIDQKCNAKAIQPPVKGAIFAKIPNFQLFLSENQAEQIELGISSGSSSSVELQTVNDQLCDGQTVIYNQEYIYPGNNDLKIFLRDS